MAASKGAAKFSDDMLAQFREATGIESAEAWANVWGIIAKSEHDRGPADWDLSDDGKTPIFFYAAALPYDWRQRGVTLGCVGFTTANSGKAAWGDAQALFRTFKAMGGADLEPMCDDAHVDPKARDALICRIKDLMKNSKTREAFVRAQIAELLKPTGYIGGSVKLLRERGFERPSALAVAALFDHSLNCGLTGPDGTIALLKKIPPGRTEEEFLEAFCKVRLPVAGKNNYASCKQNGENRAKIIRKLLRAKCQTLVGCDAAVAAALRYRMV
jgi:hypothetical protein